MNQVISTRLAIAFTCVFAFGVGFYLLKFNEKVTNEMMQTNLNYQNVITSQSLEMRKNLTNKPPTNLKK